MPGPVDGVSPLKEGDPGVIGAYELLGRLGEGGQGVVYLGRDHNRREVAIKTIHLPNTQLRGLFAREAEHAKKVARHCTAQVLAFDFDADPPYIVSEYIPGPSLRTFVQDGGALVGADLERLAIGLATALAAIERAKLVHRDFKPGNVIMGSDGPRIIDFGIARRIDTITPVDGVVGTPGYMAPEQLDGNKSIGPSCDMWAWAATVVYAASGRPPYEAATVARLRALMRSTPPFIPDVDDPLRSLITKCLDPDPARRPTALQTVAYLIGGSSVESPEDILWKGTSIASTLTYADSPIAARCATLAEESLASEKLALAIDHATRGINSIQPGEPPQRAHARCYYVRGTARMRSATGGGLDDLQRAHEIDSADRAFATAFAHALLDAGPNASEAYQVAPHDPRVRTRYVQLLLEQGGAKDACRALELESSAAVIRRCARLLLDGEQGDGMLDCLRGHPQLASTEIRQMFFPEAVRQLVERTRDRQAGSTEADRILSLNPDEPTRDVVALIGAGKLQAKNEGGCLGCSVGIFLITTFMLILGFIIEPPKSHVGPVAIIIVSLLVGVLVGGIAGALIEDIAGGWRAAATRRNARQRLAAYLGLNDPNPGERQPASPS
jgi:predicted Ser/Thr protein kinase